MNFKLLICNNCENEKEEKDNFLFIDDKNSNELLKNINTDISVKSLLSSSNNNNITNSNLIIIEYPYNYSNTKDKDNIKDDTTLQKQSSKHKEKQNDKVTYNIALPKFSHEPKFIGKKNNTNNITHEKKELIVSNSFLNSKEEEKHEQNNDLLFNYIKNCDKMKIKNNNERKSDESENKDKYKDKDKDFDNKFNIINNIHNLIGLKMNYPCPDIDSFQSKTNNLFKTSLKNENEKIEKNKREIEISLFQNNFDFFGCGLVVGVSLEGDFCSVSALLGELPDFECCLTLGVCGGLECFPANLNDQFNFLDWSFA